MQTKFPLSKVMLCQSAGFLAVIALSWFVEVTGLRSLVLGDHPYISDFRESTLEMLLVLGVWLLVATSTRRILTHARYLEGFMRVCSWCHHIDYNDEWIPLDEFLRKGFDTPTTHGICPKCLERQMAAIDNLSVARRKPPEQDRECLPSEWRKAAEQADSAQA
jgi:hypothetical protein